MSAGAADRRPLVTAAGLTVRHGGVAVLDRVDLAVSAGEIVTVVGPNGSGKTTLLRAVLGLGPPDEGRVETRPGLRIGYMPQRVAIDETLPLTVRRFLTLAGRVPDGRRREVLAEVGIGHLLDHPVQKVSGGEMQRVLLARAILREPGLLVLDEPAQSLDLPGQSAFYTLIATLRDRLGCGVLMVSHDLHIVIGAADRVICLNHHVCCTGAPQEVSEHPEYLALFPGRQAGAMGVYTHRHDHVHGIDGDVVPLSGGGGETSPARRGAGHGHG